MRRNKLLLFLTTWMYFIYSEASTKLIFQNMKVDLNESVVDRKLHLSKHITSNKKPQLFILKSCFSNVQIF